MAERYREFDKYEDYVPQGAGDMSSDRFHQEWPRLKGEEVNEAEYRRWMKKEGYSQEDAR